MLQPVLVRPVGDGVRARSPASGGGARPGGSGCRRSRRWSARPTTPPRSSRRWSRTSTATDLNPLEEAAAYQQLIEDFGLTHEEVAARVGRSRAAVTNTLRLLQLPPVDPEARCTRASSSMGHARALLGTPDRAFQEQLAKRVVERGPVGPGGRGGGPRAPGRRRRPRPATAAPCRRRRRRAGGSGRRVCSSSRSCSATTSRPG